MRPIAVIPARGTSERLPHKNLCCLGGKPLTQWAIEAAQKSELFGAKIYVTTDDPKIMALAKKLGAYVLCRHKETARKDATLDHVLLEVREQLNTRAPIYLLTPTSPFRNPATMRRAWTAYTNNEDVAKVVSVTPYHDPPHWALKLCKQCDGGQIEPMFPDDYRRTRSDLPTCVQQDGSHVIEGMTKGYTMGFETPPGERLDINTLEDLEYGEYLLSKGRITWL